MLDKFQPRRLPFPNGWQSYAKSAVLHAIALAHYAIVYARARATDSINPRVRLAAQNDRLQEECALRIAARTGRQPLWRSHLP